MHQTLVKRWSQNKKKSCNAKRVDVDMIQIVLQYFTNLLIHCGTLIMDKIFW